MVRSSLAGVMYIHTGAHMKGTRAVNAWSNMTNTSEMAPLYIHHYADATVRRTSLSSTHTIRDSSLMWAVPRVLAKWSPEYQRTARQCMWPSSSCNNSYSL
eukprot:5740259-Pyramimonas_sp.AAC.1